MVSEFDVRSMVTGWISSGWQGRIKVRWICGMYRFYGDILTREYGWFRGSKCLSRGKNR
jgi:hypothetical protein